MLTVLIKRWNDLGKPLQMIPKDFKDRILDDMQHEIKLNYRKWLVYGREIDMFEMLSIVILYSRCDLNKKLEIIFRLYCYNDEIYMQKGEFKFMINKLTNYIAATIQIKQAFMQELMRNIDQRLLGQCRDFVYEKDFVNCMNLAFMEMTERLEDLTSYCDTFSQQFRLNRLPDYLKPNNHFLGQYNITEVVPYYKIDRLKLSRFETVFNQSNTNSQEFNQILNDELETFIRRENMKAFMQRASGTRDQKISKIQDWSKFMNFKYLFNINYSFRIRTEAVFSANTPHIFDFFIANDSKFEQFYLF